MVTHEEVKTSLRQLIAEFMYMDESEVDENELFSDFGLESITLVKIIEKISEKYSCRLEVKDVLPHQTLEEASRFIFSEISDSIIRETA